VNFFFFLLGIISLFWGTTKFSFFPCQKKKRASVSFFPTLEGGFPGGGEGGLFFLPFRLFGICTPPPLYLNFFLTEVVWRIPFVSQRAGPSPPSFFLGDKILQRVCSSFPCFFPFLDPFSPCLVFSCSLSEVNTGLPSSPLFELG